MPQPSEVKDIIEVHLKTFPKRRKIVEVGFFGGNFTGIALDHQEEYLRVAYEYLTSGEIHGIRLSTRPDYINELVIRLLKKYRVSTVELGAQSMVEEVLGKSSRGHTAADTIKAARMIKLAGMRLGLQMMIGLPGDTLEYDLRTAKSFVELGADDTRIYPTLVIRGTALEKLYLEGSFEVLSMDEAIERTTEVYKIFEEAGVRVIRVGLHPSEGLLDGNDLVAGPFHESFRELVMTRLWGEKLSLLKERPGNKNITIYVSPGQFNFAIGYEAKNKKALLQFYDHVVFMRDETLKNREYHVDHR
jgi:histone acetyltransferase (RNA polymerase elongator complex component)